MTEICLNANAARPYGACAMPVRRFAAASRWEARTYGCGASPLLTPPHTAGMQICSCEKMSVQRVELLALAKCRAGESTRPSVRAEMLESLRAPSNTGALSTLLPLPRDHRSTRALALCKTSLQIPYQPFKYVCKNWQGKEKGRRAAGAIQENSVFSGNLFQLIHFSNSCRLQSLLT